MQNTEDNKILDLCYSVILFFAATKRAQLNVTNLNIAKQINN